MVRKQLITILISSALMAISSPHALAYIKGPYSLDANTSHLWHFDDAPGGANDTLAQDAVTANAAYALRSSYWQSDTDASTKATASGATLGNPSLSGYGQSILNTAGLFSPADPVATIGSSVMGMYPNLDPNTASSDNQDISDFFGTNGAFTVEGLYRVDWDPTIPHSAPSMNLMSIEEDDTSVTTLGAGGGQRVFQIYLAFSGSGASALNPRIVFDSRAEGGNANPDTSILLSATNIGTLEQGGWYHMAATYNGDLGQAGNFKFYFTKVTETAGKANLIGSSTWTNPYPTSGTADFAVGNSARNQANAFGGLPGEAWFGAIDEVRISDTARSATDMVFSPDATFEINRTTGAITLVNSGIAPLQFLSYKLESTTLGALEQANWKSIANNYDADHPGPDQVDPNENWTILSTPGLHTDFNEEVFVGTGATIALGDTLLLGNAGAWIATSVETDLTATIRLSTGDTITAAIVYTGNGGDPLFSTDLNASGGAPTAADWIIFKNNYRDSLSGLTLAQAHRLGDMDGDFDVDPNDFRLFRIGFNAANGAGALEAVISSAVPEPSSVALLAIMALVGCFWTVRRWASTRHVLSVALVSHRTRAVCLSSYVLLLATTQSAFGVNLLNYQFETVDGTGPTGQTTPDSSGNFVSTPGTINAVLGHGTNTPGTDFPNLLPGPVRNFAAGVKSRNPDSYMNFPGNPATGNIGANIERVEIAAASSGALNTTFSNFSVALWLNPSSDDRDRFAIGKIGGSGQRGWQIYADQDSTNMFIDYFATTGGSDRSLFLANALPLNTWTHVLFTFDGGTQTDAVYINNVLQTPTSVGGLMEAPVTLNSANSANFRVGHRGATGNDVASWAGGIDDVMIFDETLQFTPTGSLTGTGSTLAIAPQPGITINKLTGEIRFVNPTEDPIDFSLYDIASPGNHLLDTWSGLGNLDAIGTGEGEKWEKSSNPDGSYISELFLLGNSTVPAGQSLSFGTAYETGIEESGVVFTYYDVGADQILTGKVEFISELPLDGDHNGDGFVNAADYALWRDNSTLYGGNPGGYNQWRQNFGASQGSGSGQVAIPEPASLTLLGIGLFICGLLRGGRFVRQSHA